MKKPDIYLYLLIMALVTYLVRVLPLTLIRREIRHPLLRSFLYYVPYVTLSVMTFPAILSATESPVSASIAFFVAMLLAFRGKGLFKVAVFSCAAVFFTELLL